MLKSPNYVDSVEKGELVPSITLNKFNTDEEEWTWWELLQIIYKSMVTMDESGNNNPALWRIGPENDGIYLAVTDAKVATRCFCTNFQSRDKALKSGSTFLTCPQLAKNTHQDTHLCSMDVLIG